MSVLPLEAATVLAHQGGWDEILMVLTPIALFAGLLWLANSRAKQLQVGPTPSEDGPPADPASETEPAAGGEAASGSPAAPRDDQPET